MPEATGTINATLPRAAVREMVAKTQFAITGEDTRYFLNGALFILQPGSMTLVATDGHRLALVNVDRPKTAAKGNETDEVRAILPRKTLWELGRLLTEGGDGDIRYERGENHLFFEIGGRIDPSRFAAYGCTHREQRIECIRPDGRLLRPFHELPVGIFKLAPVATPVHRLRLACAFPPYAC